MLSGHDTNHNEDTFDTAIFQGSSPICAIRSQQIIMRDYGIQIPHDELVDYSAAQGWYDKNGTCKSAIGNLLSICGIGIHTSEDNNIYDLVNELQAGHRVIVGVDSHELWSEPGSEEWEFYNSRNHADHALIVAGLRVDPAHPEDSTVILTDPGQGNVYIEYPMEHFVEAWKDANFYMMATDEPAPYQYNEETHMMELSNFATEYTVSQFPFNNEFSSLYDFEEAYDYEPYYAEGHLDYITENISYEDFMEHWDDSDYDSLNEMFGINYENDMEDSFSDDEFVEY